MAAEELCWFSNGRLAACWQRYSVQHRDQLAAKGRGGGCSVSCWDLELRKREALMLQSATPCRHKLSFYMMPEQKHKSRVGVPGIIWLPMVKWPHLATWTASYSIALCKYNSKGNKNKIWDHKCSMPFPKPQYYSGLHFTVICTMSSIIFGT